MPEPLDRLTAALAGRYRIERQLAGGGMATVYLAEDVKHHRQVALKVLRPELAAVLGPERFLREIEIAAKLNHPHILPLFDSGEANGMLYYVMPYVAGESLRDRLNREKQLAIEDALQVAHEVADALDYAHRQGLVHRDIKPENILLEERHAVVADFGIARAISVAVGEKLTATGVAVGTPEYMSPEQASGRGELDGRSDVYALGCVLHEMLAGQPPFTGPTVEAVVRQHLTAAAPAVSTIREAVPARVTRAIQRALAKAPADRFSSATQFSESLVGSEPAALAMEAAVASAPARRGVVRMALFGIGGVVAAAGVLWALGVGRGSSSPATRVYEPTAIAVLPFQNLSAEAQHAYFSGGLHDEILTQLSKVAALSLRGRTSVMGYTGTTKSIRQIARELEVGSLVEGSVQVVGGQLRVNVQLINAATDEYLWAERYDRSLDDAFAIQSDIAQQIVAAVGAALSGGERRGLAQAPTANAEAYRLYLQGREYWNRPAYLKANFEIAQQLIERALVLDSSFALAHAALSRLHGWMYRFGYDPSPERIRRQRAEAEVALRLAPDLPETHFAIGLTHYLGGQFQRALEEMAIALHGKPNDAELWQFIGFGHRRLGNWNETLAALGRAATLDPRDPNVFMQLGITYRFLRRYREAVEAYQRALSLAPDVHEAAVEMGGTYVAWHGQLDTLRAVLSRVPTDAQLTLLGTRTAEHLQLLRWDRQPDSLLRVLAMSPTTLFVGVYAFVPRSLYVAWAQQMRGDFLGARADFASAGVLLDSAIGELPDDWRVHVARGLALAGIGRRSESLREARWIEQTVTYRHDPYDGSWLAERRAQILAQTGEADAALDEIERLLARPSWLSVHTLRLDPLWDPVRDHPRFKALLAKYAER